MPHKSIQLISDLAIAESENSRPDALEFSAYADVIASTVRGTRGPFTIGVFGEWGMGKTSLMRLVEKKVQENNTKDSIIIPVWFNAWMFERVEYPVIPLIKVIIKELKKNESIIEKVGFSAEYLIDTLNSLVSAFKLNGKLSIPGAEIGLEFNPNKKQETFARLRKKRNIIPENQDSYEKIFDALEKINEEAVPKNVTIMVLIDDLDRCFPENAVRLLENIKLILSQPGFMFILGASRDVIEGYLQSKYKKQYGLESFDGRAYLDKMIQLTFDIPPHSSRIDNFTKELVNGLDSRKTRNSLSAISSIISEACLHNPRTIIRFINRLITDNAIYERKVTEAGSVKLPIGMFAITRSLQQRWRDIYGYLVDSGDQNEDREYCEIVSAWTERDVVEWSNYAEVSAIGGENSIPLRELLKQYKFVDGQALKQIALYMKKDRILRSILMGKVGNKWLKNHKMRESSISFLTTQPTEDLVEVSAEIAPRNLYNHDSSVSQGILGTLVPQNYDSSGKDILYNDALITVVNLGRASTSLLQRKLRIGYSRAARIIEELESNGVIGPADGSRPREILMAAEDLRIT